MKANNCPFITLEIMSDQNFAIISCSLDLPEDTPEEKLEDLLEDVVADALDAVPDVDYGSLSLPRLNDS